MVPGAKQECRRRSFSCPLIGHRPAIRHTTFGSGGKEPNDAVLEKYFWKLRERRQSTRLLAETLGSPTPAK